MCHEISNIYIKKDISQYMHFWEKVPYAQYFWDRTRPNNWLFGWRIPCVRYFSQNSFLNFYPKNGWFSCYFMWQSTSHPHFLHIFKLKNEHFGDSDFFIQKGTYFPYIYLPFLKPTQTGFIEKRPIFQVFEIFRQLQKIPDAQFQSGSHLSGATQNWTGRKNHIYIPLLVLFFFSRSDKYINLAVFP